MCRDCHDFIKKGSKILDVGCGSGIVAKKFESFFGVDVLGVDIKDQRANNIPFQIIDGYSLPFLDNSFDVVLMSFVLHHSNDPIILLKEAKRVSRNKIIIYEDLPECLSARLFCKIHNITFNQFFQGRGLFKKANFKKQAEWEEIFKNLGLRTIFKKKLDSCFIYPVKKLFVVLGV